MIEVFIILILWMLVITIKVIQLGKQEKSRQKIETIKERSNY